MASLSLARARQEDEHAKHHCQAAAQTQITMPTHGVLLIGNVAAEHDPKMVLAVPGECTVKMANARDGAYLPA